MAGLYPNIDVYTSQLRKLEAFVSANPTSTTSRFVLAYHYLTQGHTDAAVSQFKAVVALTPQDTLSAQLVKQFSPPAAAPDTAAATTASPPVATTAKQGNLAGNWTAHPAGDTTINLRIGDDETFTWKVTAKGKPRQLTGKWSLTNNLLTLAQEGDAGALVGRVSWQVTARGASASSGRVPRIRGSRSSPAERRHAPTAENSADPILMEISGPGDRACFLSEFPESPIIS